jgi:hypothetical protein
MKISLEFTECATFAIICHWSAGNKNYIKQLYFSNIIQSQKMSIEHLDSRLWKYANKYMTDYYFRRCSSFIEHIAPNEVSVRSLLTGAICLICILVSISVKTGRLVLGPEVLRCVLVTNHRILLNQWQYTVKSKCLCLFYHQSEYSITCRNRISSEYMECTPGTCWWLDMDR